jgi:sugar phosphate isomerase/epimerase
MSLRYGYGLNGFAGHRLADALAVVADLGYDGVALTLDHPHLDPLADDLAARTAEAGALLARHGLDVVVETGARYVLDPWHKHEPTLVSAVGRARRTDLLLRAVRVAADLGAQAVSFWSGTVRDDAPPEVVWDRLTTALDPVLALADRLGVTLAMEPEPGMFVDTLDGVLATRRRLDAPEHLRVTVDVGHLRCNEDAPPAACVESIGELIANVQVDDMRRGVHEHLPFGEGEVDLPAVLDALRRVGFGGLVAVELPRHSHAAPDLARSSLAALRAAETTPLGGAA